MASTSQRLHKLKVIAGKALEANDYEKAWLPVTEILSMDPDDPQALYMTGCWFRMKGYPGVALQFFRRCVAVEPSQLNPWLFYGASLHDIHRYDEAIELFKMCIGMAPNKPAAYANLAASHVQKGEFPQAYGYAKEALKRDKDHENAKICLGMASLGLRRWKEGFEHYRYLFGNQVVIRYYGQEQPEWGGQSGQTVVVQGDQGLGDEIMYASILEDMAKTCRKVVYDCHPKLVNVLSRSFPGIDFHGSKKDKKAGWVDDYRFDARVHASALGRFFRQKDSDFPRQPYLQTDPAKVAKWQKVLARLPRPWVGLTWQGGSLGTQRDIRSIEPEDWLPVIEKGGSFIDLSYHDSTADLKGLEDNIHRFETDAEDYDDTLALIECLDAVCTVTTTVVHACGALGKKAYVLVSNMPQWRYGATKDDMPWYGRQVRLFRQGKAALFAPAIQQIAQAYARDLSRKPSRRDHVVLDAGYGCVAGI